MSKTQVVVLNQHDRECKICGKAVKYRKVVDPVYPHSVIEEIDKCHCFDASLENTVPSGGKFVLSELARECASCGRSVVCRQIVDPIDSAKIHTEFIMGLNRSIFNGFPRKVLSCVVCNEMLSLESTLPSDRVSGIRGF